MTVRSDSRGKKGIWRKTAAKPFELSPVSHTLYQQRGFSSDAPTHGPLLTTTHTRARAHKHKHTQKAIHLPAALLKPGTGTGPVH